MPSEARHNTPKSRNKTDGERSKELSGCESSRKIMRKHELTLFNFEGIDSQLHLEN